MSNVIFVGSFLGSLKQVDAGVFIRNNRYPWAAFSDEEWSYVKPRQEKILRYFNFRHILLKLQVPGGDELQQVLGLVSGDDDNGCYVELDDFSAPLTATQNELEAVVLAEGLIAGETADSSDLLQKIIELTEKSHPRFRMVLFERLMEHFLGLDSKEVPLQLYQLFPWDLLNQYLDRILELTGSEVPDGLRSLSIKGSWCSFFGGGVEKLIFFIDESVGVLEMDRKRAGLSLSRLSREIRQTDPEKIPASTRERFDKVLVAIRKYRRRLSASSK